MPDGYFKRGSKKFDVIIFNKNSYFKADLKEIKSKNSDTIANAIGYGGTQAGSVILDVKSKIEAKKLSTGIYNATNENEKSYNNSCFLKG